MTLERTWRKIASTSSNSHSFVFYAQSSQRQTMYYWRDGWWHGGDRGGGSCVTTVYPFWAAGGQWIWISNLYIQFDFVFVTYNLHHLYFTHSIEYHAKNERHYSYIYFQYDIGIHSLLSSNIRLQTHYLHEFPWHKIWWCPSGTIGI